MKRPFLSSVTFLESFSPTGYFSLLVQDALIRRFKAVINNLEVNFFSLFCKKKTISCRLFEFYLTPISLDLCNFA